MRFKDAEVSSISDVVSLLDERSALGFPVWFRGQEHAAWGLIPSLARKKKTTEAESTLIKRFKQNALVHITSRPADEWEWLFLMQHYRLPTRLLDWTESPLAGLYFAVASEKHKTHDAALWCLDPIALNHRANINFSSSVEVPAFGHDDVLDSYLPSRIASEKTSDLNPIAAIAVRNSPRIAAQLGTFTITHREHTALESIGDAGHVWRMVIPSGQKPKILKELGHLRVTRLTLFPELDSVAANALESIT